MEESGYSKVDDFVMSISIDRPTFFNFINPNRSFFVNFQFFVRYIKGYKGSRDDRDGMYGVAEGPWSAFITMTAFTGYFQDRLNPGITLAFDPTTSTGAAFWRLGYKFSASFSTSLRVNQFWGHPTELQRDYYPVFGYTAGAVTTFTPRALVIDGTAVPADGIHPAIRVYDDLGNPL